MTIKVTPRQLTQRQPPKFPPERAQSTLRHTDPHRRHQCATVPLRVPLQAQAQAQAPWLKIQVTPKEEIINASFPAKVASVVPHPGSEPARHARLNPVTCPWMRRWCGWVFESSLEAHMSPAGRKRVVGSCHAFIIRAYLLRKRKITSPKCPRCGFLRGSCPLCRSDKVRCARATRQFAAARVRSFNCAPWKITKMVCFAR